MFKSKTKTKSKSKPVSKTKKAKKPSQIRLFLQTIRAWLGDPRVQAVNGVLMMAGSIFMVIALISGMFTGASDYALVAEGVVDSPSDAGREPFHNWLGGAGAHFAFWLGRQGFGLGALALPVLLGRWSWVMISQRSLGSRWTAVRNGFFWLVFTPWVSGYAATLMNQWGNSAWDHWIGATGRFVTDLGLLYLGTLGSGLAIATVILAIAAYHLQPSLNNLPRFSLDGIKSWFISEDGEASVWAKSPEEFEEDAPDVTPVEEALSIEPDEASDAILDDLLDDIQRDEKETSVAEEPFIPDTPTHDSSSAPVNELPTQTADDDVAFEVKEVDEETQLSGDEIDKKVQDFGEYDPTLDLSRYELPNIDLLVQHGDGKVKVTEAELDANKTRIIETLRNFSIEVSSITAEVGPTVTLYEIVPAPGIRISKIKNLEDDIALSLAALGIRIIAPIPGRGTIGIEVPNSHPDIVSMRALIASDKFNNSNAALPIAIGKTISNETFVFDLAKMPHLLMAGATGQGKSVGLNAMLVSLLYRKHPAQLKFVLVDPKKVELTLFNHIERHYLAKLPDSEDPIITDTSKVVATLNSLCIEMDQRYDLLKEAQCRNIAEYNKKFIRRRLNPEEGHRYLPYIVLVVDEFADLIMTAGKEVETPIARLAQLARAIGIHLIIATQRPSVNIITGTIKANFPARIAFRVTSKIDSRTILDAGGAEQLIGRGDMLLSTGNDLIRIQCGFVDTPEVEEICEYIGSQQGYPDAFLLPEYTPEGGSESGHISDDERDAMFEDAARVIVMHQQGSTSLLQRKLKVGYNRAGRIIDQLEDAGIIGPFEGSKARKVLVPDEMSLEQMLQKGDA
ncbi:MAG: cell division protein FtsK [Flavobacteriales bacterium]|nr:cell division protein FtsK [Flavobacteriales bacterium]